MPTLNAMHNYCAPSTLLPLHEMPTVRNGSRSCKPADQRTAVHPHNLSQPDSDLLFCSLHINLAALKCSFMVCRPQFDISVCRKGTSRSALHSAAVCAELSGQQPLLLLFFATLVFRDISSGPLVGRIRHPQRGRHGRDARHEQRHAAHAHADEVKRHAAQHRAQRLRDLQRMQRSQGASRRQHPGHISIRKCTGRGESQ